MHGDNGQIWESFGGHCVAKPSIRMDPPNRRKRPHPPPCSSWVKQREFLEVLSRLGRRCCSPVLQTVRTPRWIPRNPTLPDASTGSSSKTVHFQKMTAMASDGPTSYAVLEQVPLWLLQTYKRLPEG